MSNRIKLEMARKGIKAFQLAQDVGTNISVMSYLINDKAMPTKELLKRICETLECQPNDLYDLDELVLVDNVDSKTITADEMQLIRGIKEKAVKLEKLMEGDEDNASG